MTNSDFLSLGYVGHVNQTQIIYDKISLMPSIYLGYWGIQEQCSPLVGVIKRDKFSIPQVHFRPQLRAVLLAPGPHQLRLHQDRTRESIYNRPEVSFPLCPLSKSSLLPSLTCPTTKLSRFSFSPEPLGEPRARRAGPAARRPHPAQQEEGRQGAHVRRRDIHSVLAAAADLPGLVRHSPARQQVS